MEEQQVPPSQSAFQVPLEQITPDQLNELKARARELAVRQAMAERQVLPQPAQPPQVVYVRRNLTVAELLIVLLISCGIVTGIQLAWKGVSHVIPRIEVKVK